MTRWKGGLKLWSACSRARPRRAGPRIGQPIETFNALEILPRSEDTLSPRTERDCASEASRSNAAKQPAPGNVCNMISQSNASAAGPSDRSALRFGSPRPFGYPHQAPPGPPPPWGGDLGPAEARAARGERML